MTIKAMQSAADKIIKANIGYDQSQRWSFLDKKNKTIIPNKETDCSASCGAIAYLGGYLVDLSGTFYTGNFAAKMVQAGFEVIKFKSLSQVKAGDFLLTPGHHVVFARTAKKFFSAEFDERGRSSGGKGGNQNGREVRYRTAYVRPGGWTYIIRRIPMVTLKGRSVKHFAQKNNSKFNQDMKFLIAGSPYDGPLYDEFFNYWTGLNFGMHHAYNVSELTVPQEKHAFVVLGSALNKDGTLTGKFTRRLDLAIGALNANPNSKVIVSGGKPYNGVTEGEAGLTYLVKNGIDPSRIITEEQSNSTVGNAKYSIPLLVKNGFTTYTLVSDASHLRRASILFEAAKLEIETRTNKRLDIDNTQTLAFRDSGSTEIAVESSALLEIAKEVAYVLGISAQFNAA